MIRFITYFLTSLLLIACSNDSNVTTESKQKEQPKEQESKIQNGDIIFQISLSKQSAAIRLATHSDYSHVGIIFDNDGEWVVYEAMQPVMKTPLKEWIDRGENDHYVIKRLKDAKKVLTKSVLQEMQEIGEDNIGKDYDIYFNWSDDQIYCSELVWKIYDEAAGIHIGELKELKDFDLTSEAVREIMAERYGNSIPLGEKVIAPSDLFDSKKLVLVDQH